MPWWPIDDEFCDDLDAEVEEMLPIQFERGSGGRSTG
jgi:hypothetical protein